MASCRRANGTIGRQWFVRFRHLPFVKSLTPDVITPTLKSWFVCHSKIPDKRKGERERETDRERQRERERETDRERDRDREREGERERQRER